MNDNYNDYELLDYIYENNDDATNILLKKYEPLIISTAQRLIKYISNNGIDLNDLIQEGRIGLFNAIDTFKSSKETLFYTYAKTCIERKIYDLLKISRRGKQSILNNSIPFEIDDEFGESKDCDYFLKDNTENPEKKLINDETMKEIFEKAYDRLTDLEIQIFELKVSGFDNKEIVKILDVDYKKVDNTLQRIKAKLKDVKKSA